MMQSVLTRARYKYIVGSSLNHAQVYTNTVTDLWRAFLTES